MGLACQLDTNDPCGWKDEFCDFRPTANNNGVYVPTYIVQGRHIYFAVDSVDFAEDTPDEKRTLHGTAVAIYKKCQPEDDGSPKPRQS